MVIHQNGTKNRDHSGKAEKKKLGMRHLIFIPARKKQFFPRKSQMNSIFACHGNKCHCPKVEIQHCHENM